MKPKESNNIKQQLLDDIRVEVIAAELEELGVVRKFYFRPKGTFRRNFRKDILEEYEERGPQKELKSIHWDVSREGIYDMLPEGLFHKPQRNKHKKVQDMIDEYQKQQKEEEDARNFFLPLEQTFYQQRLDLERKERQALDGFSNQNHTNLWKIFLGLKVNLNARQFSVLMSLIPIVHHIAGDWEATQSFMSTFLGEEVRLEQLESTSIQLQQDLPVLGVANLGVNFVAGNSFDDGFPKIKIVVGPVEKDVLSRYLPEAEGRKILDLLCGYLLPMEIQYEIEIEVHEDAKAFEFDSENHFAGRLGYTTELLT